MKRILKVLLGSDQAGLVICQPIFRSANSYTLRMLGQNHELIDFRDYQVWRTCAKFRVVGERNTIEYAYICHQLNTLHERVRIKERHNIKLSKGALPP